MGKIVIAVGIRGVGKSTIMEKVVGKTPGVKVVTYSDLMLEICKKKGMANNRDDLRKIPNTEYTKIREEVWHEIGAMKDNIIVDTHAFVEHTGRYIPGLPTPYVHKLKGLCGLFYVDADNDTIRTRSAKDHTRIREGKTDIELNNYRYANVAALAYHSTALNIPFYVIFNEDGKLDQAVEIFSNHLKDAFGEKQ